MKMATHSVERERGGELDAATVLSLLILRRSLPGALGSQDSRGYLWKISSKRQRERERKPSGSDPESPLTFTKKNVMKMRVAIGINDNGQ